MQTGETLGERRHGRTQRIGIEIMAMDATRAMAITAGEVQDDLLAGRHDAIEVAIVAFQIELTARDRDFVEPDEFFQGFLAIAHYDDVHLLHDDQDPPIVLAGIAMPNDLELQSVDLLLQHEVFLRARDPALQLRFIPEETHARAILADFGLEDQGITMAGGKRPGFLEPLFHGVFHRKGEQGTTTGIPLEGAQEERLGIPREATDATERRVRRSKRGQAPVPQAQHQDADPNREIEQPRGPQGSLQQVTDFHHDLATAPPREGRHDPVRDEVQGEDETNDDPQRLTLEARQ